MTRLCYTNYNHDTRFFLPAPLRWSAEIPSLIGALERRDGTEPLNSLGAEAPGRNFQPRFLQMKIPSPIGALERRDGTEPLNSLGAEAPGRNFQPRFLQMKISSPIGALERRDGTKIGGLI